MTIKWSTTPISMTPARGNSASIQAALLKPRLAWGRSLTATLLLTSAATVATALPLPLPTLGGERWTLGAIAWAQSATVSPEEIMGYARSVLEMEGPRTNAYNEIKTLLQGTEHDINAINLSCSGTASLNALPRNLRNSIRSIVVDYCNQASQIVQANGLRHDRFDAITAAHAEDPVLAEQIRTALIQLQQQSQSAPRSGGGSGR